VDAAWGTAPILVISGIWWLRFDAEICRLRRLTARSGRVSDHTAIIFDEFRDWNSVGYKQVETSHPVLSTANRIDSSHLALTNVSSVFFSSMVLKQEAVSVSLCFLLNLFDLRWQPSSAIWWKQDRNVQQNTWRVTVAHIKYPDKDLSSENQTSDPGTFWVVIIAPYIVCTRFFSILDTP